VLISPAPTTSTRRPARWPKIFLASATAAKLIDTAPSPSAVSVRTSLADVERPVEDLAEQRACRAAVRGRLEGVLHLPENLRLPDDDRVEPGGDAEQMAPPPPHPP
jgi:hypothetical protein